MSDVSSPQLTPLETVTRFTPLGIRFRDAALEVPVGEGLVVYARPLDGKGRAVRAFLTGSGVYAFQGLDGLRAVENSPGVGVSVSPPATRRFVIQVFDTQRRFQPAIFGLDPVAFRVDVPHQGIFAPTGAPREADEPPPGTYLFSAPTRPLTAQMCAVRAQVINKATGAPAAFAVLEVAVADDKRYGITDEKGRAAVLFPHPAFAQEIHKSPPASRQSALEPQGWPLTIRVRYNPPELRFDPDAIHFPPDLSPPDLGSIFSQGEGRIWRVDTGSPAGQLAANLVFGREVVAHTEGHSELLVSPAA